MYLELLFNSFIRFVGDDYTPLSAEICDSFSADCMVRQDIEGSYAISTYIGMSQTTAINFASRYVNESFSVYDEYVQASLDDFLNLNNGLFLVNCSMIRHLSLLSLHLSILMDRHAASIKPASSSCYTLSEPFTLLLNSNISARRFQ